MPTISQESPEKRAGPGAHVETKLLEDARGLTTALGELLRVVQFRDRDRACCYDVSASQCYALKGVAQAGRTTVNDLAAFLYCDKSTASRLATALVDKGYLTRDRDVEDARVVHLRPTPAGTALCAAIEAGEAREYAALLQDFEPHVRAELNRLVTRLGRCFAASVDTVGGTCCVR